MLVQVSHMVKLTLMVLITGAAGTVNIYAWEHIFDQYDRRRSQQSMSSLVPSKYSMTAMIFIVMLSFYYFSRHVSDSTPLGGPFLPSPLCCYYSPEPDFCMLQG
ncbi:adenylate cyclase type 3-like, partial [Meleagris gallopavo]|uniref:adenylate cyclase type 3-like n=1 Tax=Meleagris gallopavo TaxID=9103 RepID=UPI000549C268